jgi:dimethylsulfoniopropionate demethylase
MTATQSTAPTLTLTPRIRPTPWSSRLAALGVASYTVYNHMTLPTTVCGLAEDYAHLRRAVQVWDVSCQRQVEVAGADAARLAQLLTVRDLRAFPVGRCGYAPVVDNDGRLLNDPVVVKLSDDRWWFSLADSDIGLWAGGLALGMGLEVTVSEPDVWPLAVQGPKAEAVMARVFGDAVSAIRFFRAVPLPFRGHEFLVARSGWSAQGGFEVYVDDADLGGTLFDVLMEVGEPEGIRAGCPNLIERIEAGLLTYGTDVTREHTPLEAGMDRYCSLDAPIEAIGIQALRAHRDAGVRRRIVGLLVGGPPVPVPREAWVVTTPEGRPAGSLNSAAWSPRLEVNVALAMLDVAVGAEGSTLVVHGPDEARPATVTAVPFPGASQRG